MIHHSTSEMLRIVNPARRLHIDAIGLSRATSWDEYVRSMPDSTFAHLHGWRAIVDDILGHQTRYLAAHTEGGEIVGVMPLVRVRSQLLGDRLVSMPFLDSGGPIGDPDAVEMLVRHARGMASASGVDMLELRSRTRLPGSTDAQEPRIAFVVQVPRDPERIRKYVASQTVQSSMRLGGETHVRLDLDQIRPFYDLLCRSTRDMGKPVLPMGFFTRALHVFEEQIAFATFYQDDRPVAAGAGLIHGETLELPWVALPNDVPSDTSAVLLGSLMEHAARLGLKRLRFANGVPTITARGFSSRWDGSETLLPWGRWPPRGSGTEPGLTSLGSRFGKMVWQKLPTPITNRVGPWIARKIP